MNIPQSSPDRLNDFEILEKAFFYFATLRRVVPSLKLKDSCSGILVFIDSLLRYLVKHNISDYGNYEK